MWEPHTDIMTVNSRSELNTDPLCLQPDAFSLCVCKFIRLYVLRLCDILLLRVY